MATQITTAMQNQVAQNYIAILGRNPDPAGFSFWTKQLSDANNTAAAQTAVVNGFGDSTEFRSTYAALTTTAAVTLLYQNVLLRAPDANGLTYWTNYANNLIATQPTLSITSAYAQTAAQIIYTAASNNSTDTPSVTARTATAVAAGTSTPTTTYTLTTGVDTITGTAGNDLLYGVGIAVGGNNGGDNTTLNIFDTISLGGGNDTLQLNTGGTAIAFAATNTPTLDGVEIINLTNQGGAITIAGAIAPAITTLGNLGTSTANATLTVTAAAATLATLNLTNVTGTGSNQAITFDTGALAGSTDAFTVNLNGVYSGVATDNAANAADITLTGPAAVAGSGFETVTINAAGTTANSIGTLAAVTGGAASTMTALNLGNNSSGTLRIYGTLDFKTVAGIDNGTITSTGSGGVDVQVGGENITMTGGAGNDTIRFATAGDLTSADSINLGGGTNTLWVADATISTTTTTALNALINAIGAQNVGFSAASTVSLAAITASNILFAGNAYTVTSVAATDFLNATGVTTGAMTLNSTIGFNTLNLNVIATGAAQGGFGATSMTGQSTVNIASTATATQAAANTIGAVTNDANTIVNVTGTQALTITSFSDSVSLNGSAFTGVLTATGSDTASSLVGGSGADVLTGGTGADTFVGGAGRDTINTGADGAVTTVITGGAAADAINLQHVAATAAVTSMTTAAADSYATAGQFDTVTFSDMAATATNTVTVTSGVLSSTIVAATSVNIGSTVVAAGSFLWVNTAGTLAATAQNGTLYQDSNSSGTIDAADLQIAFVVGGADTLAVSIVGGKAVITDTGAA